MLTTVSGGGLGERPAGSAYQFDTVQARRHQFTINGAGGSRHLPVSLVVDMAPAANNRSRQPQRT